jgi:hypothetical protein
MRRPGILALAVGIVLAVSFVVVVERVLWDMFRPVGDGGCSISADALPSVNDPDCHRLFPSGWSHITGGSWQWDAP